MSIPRKSPSRYAPRGVVSKQIALRLLPPEMAKHELMVQKTGTSSASLARDIYLRGLKSYERAASQATPATA